MSRSFRSVIAFCNRRDTPSLRQDGPKSAYVHLPFCKRRCRYCDFPIQVLGKRESKSSPDLVSEYVKQLCVEIKRTPVLGEELDTVFFGGGTPSLVRPRELGLIISALRDRFGFSPEMEMSMEADPGTFDRTKLGDYKSLGVNRISLGVQSFNDYILQLCGRSHNSKDVLEAISDIKSVGVESWSLDLISGLPHVDLKSWEETLKTAIDCDPDHVSVYDLQLEKGTAFYRWYQPETEPLPSQDLSAEMYCKASDVLRSSGYEHYEISNYARNGHRCRHNLVYWRNEAFYGFGMGATSYVSNVRFSRPRRLKEYLEWVDRFQELPAVEDQSAEDVLDTLMLNFRLSDGVHLESFMMRHGEEAESKLKSSVEEYCKTGLVQCLDSFANPIKWKGTWSGVDRLRLSDPSGFLISNDILANIFNSF